MSPQEMKELPKDEQDDQNEVGVLISDDEDIAGDEPEPPGEPDPELVNVEVEEVDDIPQEIEEGHADDEEEEDEDEDEEDEDEEDVDDDEDDDSSEGRKEEDDDSDDEDEEDDKRPFNDSDDDDMDEDDDDSDDDEEAGGYNAAKKGISVKRNNFSKGKVMPGASFPLTSGQGYKGDIEDLIRAAAQAEEGESSTGKEEVVNLDCLDQEIHAVPEVTIKATDDIECEVVNVIEVENDIEEVIDEDDEEENQSFKDLDVDKVPFLKKSHTVADDEDPPQKRMKNS